MGADGESLGGCSNVGSTGGIVLVERGTLGELASNELWFGRGNVYLGLSSEYHSLTNLGNSEDALERAAHAPLLEMLVVRG